MLQSVSPKSNVQLHSHMLTRCPYPDCSAEFEIEGELPEGDWHFKRGFCTVCKRPATLRPMKVIETVDAILQKRLESGTICSAHPARDTSFSLVSVLEDVRSLWNVGAIFRTSDGAGVKQIFLCGITGCPPKKEIAKTSLGAEDTVSWEYAAGVVPVLTKLRQKGFLIVGLERNTDSRFLSHVIAEQRLTSPCCLVVGNEVTGLSEEALALCDHVTHLPMRGVKESLNVAVAYGIAIYAVAEAIAP